MPALCLLDVAVAHKAVKSRKIAGCACIGAQMPWRALYNGSRFLQPAPVSCGQALAGALKGNSRMKKILCLSALSLAFLPAFAWAQEAARQPASAAAPEPQPAAVAAQGEQDKPAKPGTHIRYGDSGNTIEEVREGADTKSISVKPNNAAPQYQIVPDARSGQPGHYGNQGGTRVWKVLSF